MAKYQNPYLKLQELSNELWNERKGLDWASQNQKHRIFNKMEKIINQIKELDFTTENQASFLSNVLLKSRF